MTDCEVFNVTVKWSGNEYLIEHVESSFTLLQLKQRIHEQTGVLPHRQKLLSLKYKGKVPGDDVKLSVLSFKPSMKIMMMGTREENLMSVLQSSSEKDGADVVNDFDIKENEILIENRDEYLAKITRRVKEYQVKVLNEPRVGKKLLVLDVDYTLFDHRSVAEKGVELMRPYLHEFLTACYEHYDIVIWSATNMKWIETKMKELGVSSNTNYNIAFMLDSLAMITVDHPTYGVIETKPLGVIWGKYPEKYSKENSIIIDDLRRNFIMNPSNGLKIRPFREAHLNRGTDRELQKLTKYLQEIAILNDFNDLDHNRWEKYKGKKKMTER
ncbi:ubiquitin-like domain-containing CTD phosphatase 1 [Xenia sp. Carnegie-2017]|uniref:ubiquitin-like domain-containing CTD phosphatase 1 n=1 Tax=Xenia sp. Carnegie-2017 TaxID=2897299 RepID=UPI001F0426B6|nr:ubiquitin-like domain-containing CTD phosphatase 1 [Xenia sp. Carnegie-2017]